MSFEVKSLSDQQHKDSDDFLKQQFDLKEPSEVTLEEKFAAVSAALDTLERVNQKLFNMVSIDAMTATGEYVKNADTYAKAVQALQYLRLNLKPKSQESNSMNNVVDRRNPAIYGGLGGL